MKKTFPKSLKAVLWSYNLDKLDLEKDKKLIITQVLNYGVLNDIRWLYSIYPESAIKEVVKNPSRGRWFVKTLTFWLTVFELKIEENKKNTAIQKMTI